jgi:hypothetical protein
MKHADSSYLALRAVHAPSSAAWWFAARSRRDIPEAVSALLHGRTRIEVSEPEAGHALDWAAMVTGWSDADPKPLVLHRANA